MIKKLFFIFIILFSLNTCIAETIILPYTEGSNESRINYFYDSDSYDVLTLNDNQIYSCNVKYGFGEVGVNEGNYISNMTFFDGVNNYTIKENFNITDGFLCKKVSYFLTTYTDNEVRNIIYYEYNVFTTSPYFSDTDYTFIENKIIVKNNLISTEGKKSITKEIIFDKNLIVNNINLTAVWPSVKGRWMSIQYIKSGVIPKSYYVDKLPKLLSLPYKLISGYDEDNLILNSLLISGYIIGVLVFWVKVIYQSLFTLFIISLIGVIPFISYTQSKTPQSFIDRLFINYKSFFTFIINCVKYIINLIIKIIELIPFI